MLWICWRSNHNKIVTVVTLFFSQINLRKNRCWSYDNLITKTGYFLILIRMTEVTRNLNSIWMEKNKLLLWEFSVCFAQQVWGNKCGSEVWDYSPVINSSSKKKLESEKKRALERPLILSNKMLLAPEWEARLFEGLNHLFLSFRQKFCSQRSGRIFKHGA